MQNLHKLMLAELKFNNKFQIKQKVIRQKENTSPKIRGYLRNYCNLFGASNLVEKQAQQTLQEVSDLENQTYIIRRKTTKFQELSPWDQIGIQKNSLTMDCQPISKNHINLKAKYATSEPLNERFKQINNIVTENIEWKEKSQQNYKLVTQTKQQKQQSRQKLEKYPSQNKQVLYYEQKNIGHKNITKASSFIKIKTQPKVDNSLNNITKKLTSNYQSIKNQIILNIKQDSVISALNSKKYKSTSKVRQVFKKVSNRKVSKNSSSYQSVNPISRHLYEKYIYTISKKR